MNELVEFLRARLDEDEWWAREASRGVSGSTSSGEHWHWVDDDTDEPLTLDPMLDEFVPEGASMRSVELYGRPSATGLPNFPLYSGDETPTPVAGHIARHDPARVIREVAAKRAILAEHQQLVRRAVCRRCDGDTLMEPELSWPCLTVRALALPYSDHPDYREEWKP